MKDFNDIDLAEGDNVIYATSTGASARLRKGVVTKIHPNGLLSIRPLSGSNGQKYTRTVYLNTRTGQLVDPSFHVKKESHWVFKDTGREVLQENLYNYGDVGYVPREDRKWVSSTFQDYLMEITIPGGYVSVIQGGSAVVKL